MTDNNFKSNNFNNHGNLQNNNSGSRSDFGNSNSNSHEDFGNNISNNQSNSENRPYPNHYNNSSYNYVKPYVKPREEYAETDRIFSIIALILGFTAVKVMLNMYDGMGFMTAVLFLCLTLFNYFFSKKQGLKGSKENNLVFAVTLVLSAMFVVTDNDYVKSINSCLVFISNMYFVYAGYKSNNNSIIFNVFKAVVLSPFYEYGSLFNALFHKSEQSTLKKSDKSQKNIVPIIVGLVLSIPVCVVVMVLLMSSDENFGKAFERILKYLSDNFFDKLFTNIIQFIFSVPISMYIFAAVFSRAYKMKHENELRKFPKTSVRILPSSMCNAFLSPLIFIYVTFVFTQISYLFTNLGAANEELDFSSYARNGFFELCFVAVINLSVISAIMFFVKLKEKSLPKSVKIFIIAFSVLTLCLIITAIVKMQMYIDMYGMTPLRVYTSVFMIYLFIMFVVMIAKQFVFKISFTKIAYVLAVCVIAAMSLLPVDGFIAKYNIEKYNKGEIGWIGYDAMTDLDASAASVFAECDPKLVSEKSYSGETTYPIKAYFRNQSAIGDMNIYDFNLTRFFAAKTVNDFNKTNNSYKETEELSINFPENIESFEEDGYQKIVWRGRTYAPFCIVSFRDCGEMIGFVNENTVTVYKDYPITDWAAVSSADENASITILYKEENCADIPEELEQEYY